MDIFRTRPKADKNGPGTPPGTGLTGENTVARHEAILQNMSDGLLIADVSGRIMDMNPAAIAMFGFGSKEDMLRVMSGNVKPMDITGPDGKELSMGQLPMARVCAGEKFTGQEYSVYIRSTKRRWYASFSGAPVLGKDDKIEYAVLTIRDITENKQAEWDAKAATDLIEHKMNEAIEMQNRLDAVMQALPVGVALLDAQGGQVSANKRFDEIWGHPMPAAKAIGDYIQDKASWVDSGKTVLPDEWASSRTLHNGETVIGQLMRIQGFDGVQRIILSSAAPILDARGEVAGCAVAVQDITAHMRMDGALRESEERFKAIAETTPVGIGVVGLPEANFLYVNPAYVKSFGYAESEILGQGTPQIYWSPEERGRILAALKEKGYVAEYEVKLKRKDGTPFWGLSSVRPITYSGRPALLGAFVDITERKSTEEEIKRRAEELKTMNEELSRFNRAAVDRELRMIELKKQVNELCAKLGMEPKYKVEGKTN
jgi:PAS domain S-box-containing protein